MSNSDYPKADNSKVLRPYSKSMKSLLKREKHLENVFKHTISESGFLNEHEGSIMHNVIERTNE